MTIALLDLDITVYQIASATNGNHYMYKGQRYDMKKELNAVLKEEGVTDTKVEKLSDPEPWSKVKKTLVSYMEGLIGLLDCEYRGFLSGKSNFRYKIATILPYKGNRINVEKPYHYDSCRQFLTDNYKAELSVGEEADDAIGKAANGDHIIVTIDKDLDMIPGKHYNPDKDKWYEISEHEGIVKFYQQLLTGDKGTDNIPGLFGVGESSALLKNVAKLETEEDMVAYVYDQYFKRFGSYATLFMVENAQLLWIRRVDKEPLAFEVE